MIARAGMIPTSEVLSSEMVQPTERDRERFQLGPDELVYRIERIRLAGDVPVVYCIDKIPSHYIKDEEQFTSSTSLFDALEKELGRRVTHAVTHIEPRIDPKIAEQLHTDQPLLVLRQRRIMMSSTVPFFFQRTISEQISSISTSSVNVCEPWF